MYLSASCATPDGEEYLDFVFEGEEEALIN
jgi:hypothetical protein